MNLNQVYVLYNIVVNIVECVFLSNMPFSVKTIVYSSRLNAFFNQKMRFSTFWSNYAF